MPRQETLIAKAGTRTDPETGAVIPPIHLATTYERDDRGEFSRGYRYSRLENPTRGRLESALAELEGAPACIAFSSGMAAVSAIFQTLKPGDELLLPDDVYFGVRKLAVDIFGPWNLVIKDVDMTNLDQVRAAIGPATGMVWVETPSNPQLKITDIQAVAALAREAESLVVVDGTWTTPLLQRPLDLGADAVMHSITKYLSGHSDVLGGAVLAREGCPLEASLRSLQQEAGAVLDPFSSWLGLRGLRTLAVRLKHQCASAFELARFLDTHPYVSKVCYPGLPSHPGHDIAQRQMSGFGGMLSFLVDGKAEDAIQVAAKVDLFANATSLGGTESLMEHRKSIEGPDSATPDTLLRISVGLEHPDDLKQDLDKALTAVLG